jgi:hypothetical protein
VIRKDLRNISWKTTILIGTTTNFNSKGRRSFVTDE